MRWRGLCKVEGIVCRLRGLCTGRGLCEVEGIV